MSLKKYHVTNAVDYVERLFPKLYISTTNAIQQSIEISGYRSAQGGRFIMQFGFIIILVKSGAWDQFPAHTPKNVGIFCKIKNKQWLNFRQNTYILASHFFSRKVFSFCDIVIKRRPVNLLYILLGYLV